MKTKIIPIGNSKGVRLPKHLLKQVGLEEDVLLEASKGTIVIRPAHAVREGWQEAFRGMAKAGDDSLIDLGPDVIWDDREWEWK